MFYVLGMVGVVICMVVESIGVVKLLWYLVLLGVIRISLVKFVKLLVDVLISIFFVFILKGIILGFFIGE